jgi:hypothetical protein
MCISYVLVLQHLSHCIFSEVKQTVLDAALSATKGRGGSMPIVKLSNFKATESEARGEHSPETSQCMFAQAYYQLRDSSSAAFRSQRDSSQDTVFEVNFEGESGIDAGGVYREGLQRILDDLFSESFTLLVKCPNALKGYKINTSSYVPNPSMVSPLALSMFEFLGRFMGMSLRSKACLPFAFPSIVWKCIVGDRPRFEDLAAVDSMFCERLSALRNCELDVDAEGEPQVPIKTEEQFAASYPDLQFITYNTIGTEVRLMSTPIMLLV